MRVASAQAGATGAAEPSARARRAGVYGFCALVCALYILLRNCTITAVCVFAVCVSVCASIGNTRVYLALVCI